MPAIVWHGVTTAAGDVQTNDGHYWGYLFRLLRLLFTFDSKTTTLLLLLQVVSGSLAAVGVYLIQQLINVAQHVVQGGATFATGMAWAASLVGLYIVQAGLNTTFSVTANRFQEALRGHIEEAAYTKAQTLPLEQLETPAYHNQLQRVRRGMDRRLFSTMLFLWQCAGDAIAVASLLVYVGSFHWALPVLLIVGTTPGVVIRQRVHKQRYLVQRRQTPHERRFHAYAGLLTGRSAAAEVRTFGFGRWLIETADTLWQQLSRQRIALAGKEARATLISDGVNALVYVKDFFDFVDLPSVDFSVGVRPGGPLREGIVFENVSFTYPGAKRPALSGINLTVGAGERLALVGENGAGKSTLVKLLMGLYTPTGGTILVDGIDLQTIAPDAWYERVGAVFQDYNRYEVTVRENIGFGWVVQANRADLVADAATRSGAHQVVANLPNGLATPLGKTYRAGAELSVGQWQKIAIARAYMRPAEILVLDEPASALDAKAEADVYAHFARMAVGRTAILISHRLGSCRMADGIVVLRDGRLVEEGSHVDLMATKGEYAAMYESQAAWYR